MLPIFSIPEEHIETESCVYFLSYGDKYVIVKGKTLAGSIYLIEKGYAGFIAGGKLNMRGNGHKQWEGKNSFYFKFYTYIKKNPGLQMRVDVIIESNDPFLLLLVEQTALQEKMRDKKCLNSNVESYIPKYIESTKSYGWIPKMDVDRFKIYLKQPTPSDASSK